MATMSISEAMEIAVKHHRSGELKRADEIYRSILKVAPEHAPAMQLSGVIAHQVGRHQRAIEQIGRAIELMPDDPGFYSNLGAAQEALGNLAEAAGAYRRALQIRPDFAAAHNNLGKILIAQGKIEEAEAGYRRALQIDTDYVDALANLGGLLLQVRHEVREAEACCRKALDIEPDCVVALHNLGNVLRDRRKLGEAEACYRRALKIQPDCTDTLAGLARLLEWQNRLDESSAAADECLRLEPEHLRANLVAAKCDERQGRQPEAIERLEKIRPKAEVNVFVKEEICYRLGHLYDRAGDADRAFAELVEANRLSSRWAGEGLATNERFLGNIANYSEVFTRDWVESWSPAPAPAANTPVFLIGFPRSGTTLLDVVLDSHPKIQTLDEKPAAMAMGKLMQRWPAGYPQGLVDLAPARVEQLRATYFRAVDEFIDRREDHLLVDKFPLNMVHAGLILRVFPGAKFVVALRHPCDACLSCFMQDFNLTGGMTSFLTLEGAALLYDRAFGLWQQYVRILPHEYHALKYEDLVEDFEGEIRRLLQYVGVEWDDTVLGYSRRIGRSRGVDTPSYCQVTEPVYKHARYRWRRYAKYIEPIRGILEPYIEQFGYD